MRTGIGLCVETWRKETILKTWEQKGGRNSKHGLFLRFGPFQFLLVAKNDITAGGVGGVVSRTYPKIQEKSLAVLHDSKKSVSEVLPVMVETSGPLHELDMGLLRKGQRRPTKTVNVNSVIDSARKTVVMSSHLGDHTLPGMSLI